MQSKLVLLYVLLFVVGCNNEIEPDLQTNDNIVAPIEENTPDARTGNIELTSHLYLDVMINDTIPAVFLFDTGANDLILDKEFLRQNGLAQVEDRSEYNYGAGEGKLKTERLKKVSIEFDGELFEPEDSRVMELDSLFREILEHEINGIIGYDLFKDYLIEIDFDKDSMKLSQYAAFDHVEGYTSVSYESKNRKILIASAVQLDSSEVISCNLLFDMGSGRSISLTKAKSVKEGLFEKNT